MKLLYFLAWSCCIFNTGLCSANKNGSMSTQDNCGKHFVFGFVTNPLDDWRKNITLLVTIIAKEDANVIISFNKTDRKTCCVSKGEKKILSGDIPNTMIMNGDGVGQKGIEINSTGVIAVVCSYQTVNSLPVGYLAVPTRYLGESYVVASYVNQSYFGIISVNKNTSVNISFSNNVPYNGSYYKGEEKLSITLGKLGTFNIPPQGSDLSGTIIVANNTIAVISGSPCAEYNETCLYSMTFMVPVKNWRKKYLLRPRSPYYVAKIMTHRNKGNVQVNCTVDKDNYTLETSQFDHQKLLSVNVNHSLCHVNCSTKRCQVIQYGRTGNSEGEPAMVPVPPISQFLSNYRVEKVGSGKKLKPITLVVKQQKKNSLTIKIDNRTFSEQMDGWSGGRQAKFGLTRWVWRVIDNASDVVTVRSSENKTFGLFVSGWTTTNNGTISVYDSFSQLALKKNTSIVDNGGYDWCRQISSGRENYSLSSLLNEIVDSSNVADYSKRVAGVISPSPRNLTANDMAIVVKLLENIVEINETSVEVADNVLEAVDSILDVSVDVLLVSQQQTKSSSRVIETLNDLLGAINVTEDKPFQRTLKNLAVDVSKINTTSFPGVTFSGTMINNTSVPFGPTNVVTTHSAKTSSPSDATTITLPQTLFNERWTTDHDQSLQTLIFTLYKETKLFQSRNSSSPKDFSQRLNSYVIAGDIKGQSISHLKTPIVLTYSSLQDGEQSTASCVFWNLTHSYWSNYGCTFQQAYEDGRVVCHCDHLTNFAMLMDINVGEDTTSSHDEVLGIISYIGCAVSLVGLMLTIATILLFRELRDNTPTQILLNFCVSLSLALIVFITGAERSKTFSMTGCRIAAIVLHYFVLTTFMWMAISAFNMYLAFVKVLNSYFPKFMLKCSVVAWGVPAVIVAVTMAVALDEYGDEKYCRLNGIPFLAAFLAPVVLILLGNSIAFVLIFHSLLKTGSKVTVDLKITGYQQARQGAAIFVLLGLTWLFGVFAFDDAKIVFQYLFCIFNSLQGLFVFLFYCLMSPGTREKYRRFCSKKLHYRGKTRVIPGLSSTSQKSLS